MGHDAVAPLITVAMPAHDAASTIEEAMRSVLAQEAEAGVFELVIIENGSTDGTYEAALRVAGDDPRVRIVRQDHADLVDARRHSLQEARGSYMCFLDADDIYYPGFVAFMEQAIREHPGEWLYVVNGRSISAKGRSRRLSPTMPRNRTKELTLADAAWMCLYPNMVAIPKRRLVEVGAFPHGVALEDYDAWIRLFGRGGKGIYFPVELCEHRVYHSSRSHDASRYEALTDSALSSLKEALQNDLAPRDRDAVERRIALLERRRAAVRSREELEGRIGSGDLRHARRDYWRARAAYREPTRFLAGLALMALSPRMFARVVEWYHGP